jgi:hypothetical protein
MIVFGFLSENQMIDEYRIREVGEVIKIGEGVISYYCGGCNAVLREVDGGAGCMDYYCPDCFKRENEHAKKLGLSPLSNKILWKVKE